jgi:hypothetical protein
MSTLAQSDSTVYTICELPRDKAYALCRFVSLPDGASVAEGVRAVQGHYSALTGRELPVWDAIRILDRLNAERFDVPFPAAYSRIADALFRGDYSPTCIHSIIAHLRRGGAVASCPHLEAGDRAAVAELMPRDAALRARDCRRRQDAD